jgi:DNA-binding NarL/FixJ family response regulator
MRRLTPRQEQVLYGLAEGLTNEQIAAELGVHYDTAKDHVRDLLIRLGASNRAHAVALAYHQGLLKAPGDHG